MDVVRERGPVISGLHVPAAGASSGVPTRRPYAKPAGARTLHAASSAALDTGTAEGATHAPSREYGTPTAYAVALVKSCVTLVMVHVPVPHRAPTVQFATVADTLAQMGAFEGAPVVASTHPPFAPHLREEEPPKGENPEAHDTTHVAASPA